MNKIIENYKILSKLNPKDINCIKLLSIFKDCESEEKSNVILVTEEDEVKVFGYNRNGVLGLGHKKKVKELTNVIELRNKQIVDFKNGCFHSIARTSDGKVYCWGWNGMGLLGNGTRDENIYKPELNEYLNDKIITDISCGFNHSLVLTIDGEVYSWGCNSWGQIGFKGYCEYQLTPYLVSGFYDEKIKAISCGKNHSMALSTSGYAFSWGQNNFGQLGTNFNSVCYTPKLIHLHGISVRKISCGYEHSLLMASSGEVYLFGSNKWGKLEISNFDQLSNYRKFNHSNKFIDIASHYDYSFSFAVSGNGVLYIWGNDIIVPKETEFNSIYEMFANYLQITPNVISVNYRLDECLNSFFSLKNRKYHQNFDEFDIICSGNFSFVYEALHKNSNRIFAVKKILLTEVQKEKVYDELKILSKLDVNYNVEYFDFWLEKNQNISNSYIIDKNAEIGLRHKFFNPYKPLSLYIQMELCYASLKEMIQILNYELKDKSLEMKYLLNYYISSNIFIEILECVNYLHKQIRPIIHRDLAPENILITHGMNGRFVKLSSFGLSLSNDQNFDLSDNDMNNLKYKAPEVNDLGFYSVKSDIYGLGIIAKELFNFDFYWKKMDSLSKKKTLKSFRLQELIKRMTSIIYESRPNCEQILREKRLWAMSLTLLMNDKDFVLDEEFKSIEESFHMFFIQTKQRYESYEQNKNSLIKNIFKSRESIIT